MKRNNLRRALVVTAAVFLTAASAAAQEKEVEEKPAKGKPSAEKNSTEKKPVEIHQLTIYPAAETKPALRRHLLPSSLAQTPQNAAVLYLRAFVMLADVDNSDDFEPVAKWIRDTPIDELPVAEARQLLGRYRAALEEVHIAARRERCDWEMPVREAGPNLFSMLLPDVQQARWVAQLLSLQARVQIAEGELDEAVVTLRTLLAFSRHVARQPFLISGLVGIAMANYATLDLEQFIQSKDAPNLYWPLTNLPDPLVDLEPGMHLEYSAVYRVLPELQEVRDSELAPEEWDRRAAALLGRFRGLVSLEGSQDDVGTWREMSDEKALEQSYQTAKARLLQRGYDAAEIENMARSRVVLLDTAESFDAVRDEMFKAFGLPYLQAQQVLEKADRDIAANKTAGLGGRLAALLLPAVKSVKLAAVRERLRIDALRCIEALRMHAAAQGELPARLGDVAAVPIPVNPLTGKPFAYRLADGVATLDLQDAGQPVVYRIRLAK